MVSALSLRVVVSISSMKEDPVLLSFSLRRSSSFFVLHSRRLLGPLSSELYRWP